MKQRTFGWVQNPASTDKLKDVVSLFENTSPFCKRMLEERIPTLKRLGLLHDDDEWAEYSRLLSSGAKRISYSALKGKGCGGGSRSEAKCSGIVQAAIDAQKTITTTVDGAATKIKKPYTDDWTADGYLRWAVSIGFLDYSYSDDTCGLTASGSKFVNARGEETDTILGEAYLSYPPACRVLGLLRDGEVWTKFEIGRQLGFADEAGFTSYPQNIWVSTYDQMPEMREELRQNCEGSADKYARMICSWLEKIKWVRCVAKEVTVEMGGRQYCATVESAFAITAEGLKQLKRTTGTSSSRRTAKIVYIDMLASKVKSRDYIRLRRANIIKYVNGSTPKTLRQIAKHLEGLGFSESEVTIADDLDGLERIGLNVPKTNGGYCITDEIRCLEIPRRKETDSKDELARLKDIVRERLKHVNHKFLSLLDLSVDGQRDRDFELQTVDLLTSELGLSGRHLGGSRKPDGIVYNGRDGLIIDTKAYSKGYALPRSQVDEMVRYLQENKERDESRNPNRWWEAFGAGVTDFRFSFVSSGFTGQYVQRLLEIEASTGVRGAVITAEQLLYVAEKVKSEALDTESFFELFECNREVEVSV